MSGFIDAKGLHVFYNGTEVLRGVDLSIPAGKVTAIIGPSGCGKTTFLRCLNRLSELIGGCRIKGNIYLDNEDILRMDPMILRRRVSMVFQKPNPFPMSIRENILYGVKAAKNHHKINSAEIIERSLVKAALWDELRERLDKSALELSVGQQQRLCIARSLATSPEVVLLDEPASSLDPKSTARLESSILAMKELCTVVIVTHNLQEAVRIADFVAFFSSGKLIEFGETEKVFNNPKKAETKEYLENA